MRCLEALAEIPRVAGKPLSLDGQRPLHLLIAGDGPSRKTLESYGKQHDLTNHVRGQSAEYRPAATLSRGGHIRDVLDVRDVWPTVLEALACGTPAVLPHCGVFDELWIGRIPNEWIYDEGTEVCVMLHAPHHTLTRHAHAQFSLLTPLAPPLLCVRRVLCSLQCKTRASARAKQRSQSIRSKRHGRTRRMSFSSSTRRRSSPTCQRQNLASISQPRLAAPCGARHACGVRSYARVHGENAEGGLQGHRGGRRPLW